MTPSSSATWRISRVFSRRFAAASADDLAADSELSHVRVLALALRLLDVGLFRVGSDRYARDNAHYGLTTLRLDQARIRHGAATFDYVGKAGRRQHLTVSDSEAVGALTALKRRRSGQGQLFAFRGPHHWSRIHRADVNNSLRAGANGPFSAKEYRTSNATVTAAVQLAELRPAPSRASTVASRAVAEALGNAPTVARRSYIDPRIFRLYAAGRSIERENLPQGPWQRRGELEARVLATLAQGGDRAALSGRGTSAVGGSPSGRREERPRPACMASVNRAFGRIRGCRKDVKESCGNFTLP